MIDLEGNAKSVILAVKKTESIDVLTAAAKVEMAGKKRKSVLAAIEKRLAKLGDSGVFKTLDISGHIKDVKGSFWEDDAGNVYVLDRKMGSATGVFVLRLIRRARS